MVKFSQELSSDSIFQMLVNSFRFVDFESEQDSETSEESRTLLSRSDRRKEPKTADQSVQEQEMQGMVADRCQRRRSPGYSNRLRNIRNGIRNDTQGRLALPDLRINCEQTLRED